MANEFGLFFDSVGGDRVYNSDSMSEWLRRFFTTGVFNGELQVTASSGMTVNVATGYVNISGKVRFFETAQPITLDVASGSYPRIDTIVVRLDTGERKITTEYVKGEYSGANPVPTAPVREGGIYELVLAQIYVDAGVTEVTTADITDTRAVDELCGWVTGTVDEISFEQILAQSTAKFNAWFDAMKGQLDTDAAGHLQNEINDLVYDVTALSSESQFTITVGGWSQTTETINNVAYYTYVVDLTHVYNMHPIIGIGAVGDLPTADEQKAYDTFKYVSVDNVEMTMTLYSPKIIESNFVIIVKGVD